MTRKNFNGQLLVISVDGTRTVTAITGRSPTLEELQSGVGGYIEVIPFFSTIEMDDGIHTCIALCNEEGKIRGLPPNPVAQTLWEATVGRKITEDYLVGPVIIAFGSPEWLAAF